MRVVCFIKVLQAMLSTEGPGSGQIEDFKERLSEARKIQSQNDAKMSTVSNEGDAYRGLC